jgi:hypothetical protein
VKTAAVLSLGKEHHLLVWPGGAEPDLLCGGARGYPKKGSGIVAAAKPRSGGNKGRGHGKGWSGLKQLKRAREKLTTKVSCCWLLTRGQSQEGSCEGQDD